MDKQLPYSIIGVVTTLFLTLFALFTGSATLEEIAFSIFNPPG